MVRIIWWFIRILFLVIILYSLFFGNLLFINPVKLGIRQRQAEHATVYTRNLYKLSPHFNFVDQYMTEAEIFYGLKYKEKISIYVAETKEEFKRYLPPWVPNGENLESTSLQTGTVIYLNLAKISEENVSQEESLKHELMRALIYQNAPLPDAIVIGNQHWFIEGLATHFGGPEYLNDNEFKSAMKEKNLIYDERSYSLFTNLDKNDTQFNSTVYKYFVKFLIEEYGQNRFKEYINRYFQSPGNYKVIFFETYNKRFSLVVDEFVELYQ